MEYNPSEIEKKWQQRWQEEGLYRVSIDEARPKYYVLDMFPYPSGAGLHVGHPLGYIATDIYARYKRLKGFNVLHPMGYDAFGLPAEQYAIQTGVHPAVSTAHNIEGFRRQMDNIGFSYDWDREVNTSDPAYYKWTQWIFLQLFAHYYDKDADKALPISLLTTRFSEGGSEAVNAVHTQDTPFSAGDWAAMSPAGQDAVLMNYRLAYRRTGYVNWCEELGTVLANDEVKDGVSERGGFPVIKKAMVQWSLRTSAYAERLLKGLEDVDWPESLKIMQRNWIGRSEGARVRFSIAGTDHTVEIFTTRPDTIYGVTFMVLAPEHDLVKEITHPDQAAAVEAYLAYTGTRSERERAENKKVSGAFTGAYATHPITGAEIPVWIADYVLKDYGTGAIMAVPADDSRDHAFALHFGLPVTEIIDRSMHPHAGMEDKVGVLVNSGLINGLEIPEAISTMISYLDRNGLGSREIQYKLRDANYSRQRYWGEPFPITYDRHGVARALDLSELPLVLPELSDFKPTTDGRAPLSKADDWVSYEDGWMRETDTMPGFAGSSWYFLRYMDPSNPDRFASREALAYWKEVDLYMGGAEHAVGHLLYARTWHKFLHDLELVPGGEPFRKLINQGMIQGVSEKIAMLKGKLKEVAWTAGDVSRTLHFPAETTVFLSSELRDQYSPDDISMLYTMVGHLEDYGLPGKAHLTESAVRLFTEWRPEFKAAVFLTADGYWHEGSFHSITGGSCKVYTTSEVEKMSKSKYNVINPDDVIARYGADCFRMYEMFLGPIEQSKPWDMNGIDGVYKFLRRFWGLFYGEDGHWQVTDETPDKQHQKILHTAIRKIEDDIEKFSFNTCVSAFMICVNDLRKTQCHHRSVLRELVILLAPFAPHMAEELWTALGEEGSVHTAAFPAHDASWLVEDSVEYPICVNGKKRALVAFPADMQPAALEKAALELPDLQKWLEGKQVRKVIVVPGKMVNLVV